MSIVESSTSGTGWFEAAAPLDDKEEGCRLCTGLAVEALIVELPLLLIGGDLSEPSATERPIAFARGTAFRRRRRRRPGPSDRRRRRRRRDVSGVAAIVEGVEALVTSGGLHCVPSHKSCQCYSIIASGVLSKVVPL